MKIKSINPATLEVLAEFESTSSEEVFNIVREARLSFEFWSKVSLDDRIKFLKRARGLLYERRDEIARLITLENGKPIVESYSMEIFPSLDLFDFYIKNSKRILKPRRVYSRNPLFWLKRNYIHLEPLGVIGIISPWNYPLLLPIAPIISALVAGNCVVFKPSEYATLVGMKIYEIFNDSGLPDGVFNIIIGGGDVGSALIDSEVDKISFTGSTSTGKVIMERASRRLIPVMLELGGKDPMIVFDDVDVEYASSAAVWGAFANAGQTCVSVERCYVHRRIAEEFISLVVRKVQNLKVGNGLEPDVEVGPVNNERQLRIIEEQINDAVSKGAKILTGGRRIEDMGGYFFEPTVIINLNESMRIMKEETFGPVLPILTFDSEDEVIDMANGSEFALSASIWTQDKKRARRFVELIRSGSVLVNDCIVHYGDPRAPCGGVKSSGFGRVHSEFGIYEMVNIKFESFDHTQMFKLWWFGYDKKLLNTMRSAIMFLYSPNIFERIRSLPGLISNLIRKGRI